ncbi:MAG: radical SAM protein [Deltaproteobacteria bacterium]|nr:radical SAM protein [Deltaproteobacteria bacterium]
MEKPFLILTPPVQDTQNAYKWAEALDWPFLIHSTQQPGNWPADLQIPVRKTTVWCSPVHYSLAERNIIIDAIEDHRHIGADVTLPNGIFVPQFKFRISTGYLAAKTEASFTSSIADIQTVVINRYVPPVSLINGHDDLFETHFVTRTPGLLITLSEQCNLSCRMCPFNGGDIPKHLMDYYQGYRDRRSKYDLIRFENISSIIDTMERYCCNLKAVSLIGPGEPFRHPRIADIIEFFRNRGIFVSLTSNGNLISKDLLKQLLDGEGISVSFSIDAFSAETYRKIRAMADMNLLLRNIDYLLNKRSSKKQIQVKVSFVRQPLNEAEEGNFVNYWRNKADEIIVLSKYLAGRPEYPPDWIPRTMLPCADLENSIHILTNGDCWSCSAGVPDEFFLGNIFQKEFHEILNTQRRFARLRYLTGWAKELCRGCVWWRQTQHIEIFSQGRLSEIRRPYSYKIIGTKCRI